jgi:3-methyladenine DNA glycosylase AlkD
MNNAVEMIQKRLFELKDTEYKDFQCKLMPTVAREAVIGVRTPELRRLANEFSKMPESAEFMKVLPHKYYEENNLHGFLIEKIKDYDVCVAALNDFLPYVDNWATCDMMSPKVLGRHPEKLIEQIKIWLADDHTYTIRFGLGMLMGFFLDENFKPEYIKLAAEVKSSEYYVNMMIAWYFATALTKQYSAALPYIVEHRLDRWVHNKAIQKAIESRCIADEQKEYLRSLKERE